LRELAPGDNPNDRHRIGRPVYLWWPGAIIIRAITYGGKDLA
jgi:hypothetical protein